MIVGQEPKVFRAVTITLTTKEEVRRVACAIHAHMQQSSGGAQQMLADLSAKLWKYHDEHGTT